jgi:hypothetical protein
MGRGRRLWPYDRLRPVGLARKQGDNRAKGAKRARGDDCGVDGERTAQADCGARPMSKTGRRG